MSQDQKDIVKLISFVRKHEKYVGDKLNNKYNPYESIDKWVESCKIDKGEHPVKAYVLLQSYQKWCRENSYATDKIARNKTFNSTMKELLNYNIKGNNLTFYVNVKVKYDPPKRKEKKEGG